MVNDLHINQGHKAIEEDLWTRLIKLVLLCTFNQAKKMKLLSGFNTHNRSKKKGKKDDRHSARTKTVYMRTPEESRVQT